MEYDKPWMSLDDQLSRLHARGVDVGDPSSALRLLSEVGYYRLTGHLYPFRCAGPYPDEEHATRGKRSAYLPGTRIADAVALIDFDRKLRLLVLDALERIEVSFRMRVGYVLGETSAFAHTDPASFMPDFVRPAAEDGSDLHGKSRHARWLDAVHVRQEASREGFVEHFRVKYDGRMPIWALTEILEMGQLVALYRGLNTRFSQAIADAYGVPRKTLLVSWMATLTYVRNVAAHHARLFNRKLVTAPKRAGSAIPVLAHLREGALPKEFGVYAALAIAQYLVTKIDHDSTWGAQVVDLLRSFPAAGPVTVASLGVPQGWEGLDLWQPTGR